MDLWPVDIRRFGALHRDRRWVLERTYEAYAKHYTMAWPFEEYESGRPVRVSPLYARLKEQGASFGSRMGWERPNWFAPAGVEAHDVYTYGRQNWFAHVGEEHRATRERVTIFDQTSFAKFLLLGKDAERAMTWLCANDVSKPPGTIVYTQMCNERGGVECDITVSRLRQDCYYLLTGTAYGTHDAHWINNHIPAGLDARLVEVTGMTSVLSLMGPSSRAVLSQVTDADLSSAAFLYGTHQELTIGGAVVRALRMTFVGELGWELHIPVECALAVYDRLMAAGQTLGIANAGYRAIDSLRLEKGYKNWGSDLTPNDTPLEAGHAWAVKLKSEVPFLGREALTRDKAAPPRKRFAIFTVDDPEIVLLGRETILRNGQRAGYLSSAGHGYTIGKGIGVGYIRRSPDISVDEDLTTGTFALEVAGAQVPCTVHLKPLWDPKLERPKA